MCRWFTYLGEEPQLLEDLLLRPTHSIVKQIDDHFLPPGHTLFNPLHDAAQQAHRLADTSKPKSIGPASATDSGSPNPLTNMDGFGVGWWSDVHEKYESDLEGRKGMRPVVYKNTRPPLNDLVLRSLASGVETKAVVAHIRAGTGLTPVVETNCHPYTFGRHLFCHNGVLGSFHLFKTRLLGALPLRYQLAILGTTDSEHIAALYFFHLCGQDGKWTDLYPVESMRNAMVETLKVLEGWKADAEEQEGVEKEHNALNLLVNSGSSLVAIRYASPVTREPPSLYYSTTAGAALNRKFKGHPDEGLPGGGKDRKEDQGRDKAEHGKHVIVASEPSTFKAEDWDLIGANHMISASEEMEMKVEKIEL